MAPALSAGEAATARAEAGRAAEDLRGRWRAHANDRIASALAARGWTLGAAESCTGGLIGDTLTDRAGSSSYFMGGIISYDNRVKRDRLGVRPETLERFGAVSEETAREMAAGARQALGVDAAVSATGVAGPGGGTVDKPVGLVYLGFSAPGIDRVERHVWPEISAPAPTPRCACWSARLKAPRPHDRADRSRQRRGAPAHRRILDGPSAPGGLAA